MGGVGMNKRANIYLNSISFIFLLLAISFMGLFITENDLSYDIPIFLKSSFFLIGAVYGIIFLSIECFLFLLLENKFKIISISYTFIGITGAILLNSLFPFLGFILIPCIILLKEIARVYFVKIIYIPKEFDYYCKMFGIKIKDFPKKRKAVSKTKKETEKIPVPLEDSVYV